MKPIRIVWNVIRLSEWDDLMTDWYKDGTDPVAVATVEVSVRSKLSVVSRVNSEIYREELTIGYADTT